MKHISLSAKLSPDRKNCEITVIRQTHHGRNFGDEYVGSGRFIHGRIELISYSGPDYFSSGNRRCLYVQGTCTGAHKKTVQVPATLWPEIKAAVSAYNAQKAPKPVAGKVVKKKFTGGVPEPWYLKVKNKNEQIPDNPERSRYAQWSYPFTMYQAAAGSWYTMSAYEGTRSGV